MCTPPFFGHKLAWSLPICCLHVLASFTRKFACFSHKSQLAIPKSLYIFPASFAQGYFSRLLVQTCTSINVKKLKGGYTMGCPQKAVCA